MSVPDAVPADRWTGREWCELPSVRLVVFGFLFLNCLPLYAQWVLRYSETKRQHFAFSVHQTTDGGYIVLDKVSGITLLKLRADTSLQWAKSYGGDLGETVQQTADGGYVVGGARAGDALVMKLTHDGAVEWAKTYGTGGGVQPEVARSVQRTRTGGFVVAGSTVVDGIGSVWVLKLRHDGAVEWQRAYRGDHAAEALSIQQTKDTGYVVAAARTVASPSEPARIVIKLGASGDVEWQKIYQGSFSGESRHPIRQTKDGGYVMTGFSGLPARSRSVDTDLLVAKLRRDGSVEWEKRLGGPLPDGGVSIDRSRDGGYIVQGEFTDPCGVVIGPEGTRCFKVWVLKLDASGRVTWQRTYGGIDEEDYSSSIEPTLEGGYVVAGSLQVFGVERELDGWILKLNPDGTISPSCTFAGEARFAETTVSSRPIKYDLRASRTLVAPRLLRDIEVTEPALLIETICGKRPVGFGDRRPDLTVRVGAPRMVIAGEPLGPAAGVVARNIGDAPGPGTVGTLDPSNGYVIDVVLSADTAVPEGFATFSRTFAEDALLPSGRFDRTDDLEVMAERLYRSGHVAIPADTPQGNYYLCARIDPGNRVAEADEGNNTSCMETSVGDVLLIDFEQTGNPAAVRGADATELYAEQGVRFPSNPRISAGPTSGFQGLVQGELDVARPERSCGRLMIELHPRLQARRVSFEARNLGLMLTPVLVTATAFGRSGEGSSVTVDERRVISESRPGALRPVELLQLESSEGEVPGEVPEPDILRVEIEYSPCPPHVFIDNLEIRVRR